MPQAGKEVSSNLKTLPFIFKERIEDMTPDCPSNSNKSKEDKKNLTPVVNNPVKVRKKSNRLLRTIFARDLKDVQQEIRTGYIEPKVKDLVWQFIQAGLDIISNAFKMTIYENYKPSDKPKTPAERYSYSNYYNQAAPMRPTMTTEINYDEFIYKSKKEADDVLAGLKDLIAGEYRQATVHDMYYLSQQPTDNYTLQYYGWTNLDFAEVQQTDGGYIINLPKAKPLSR